MNLNELTVPVRIYWDLPEDTSYSLFCSKISEELIKTKILFLSLRDSSPQSSPCLPLILDALKNQPVSLSLTVPGKAVTPEVSGMIAGSGVRLVLCSSSALHEVRSSLRTVEQFRRSGLSAGISFDITESNFREIPEVVRFCLDYGITDLVFPIQRIRKGEDFFCISAAEREKLSTVLQDLEYRRLNITIHDYFLWVIFYPEKEYHEGGCQAANSLLYISPDCKVYPCPAMPMELGDLKEASLMEIVQFQGKKQLRQSLLSPPAECAACADLLSCRGGCRGRAFALNSSLDSADPACR